jgi:hypothetical protein
MRAAADRAQPTPLPCCVCVCVCCSEGRSSVLKGHSGGVRAVSFSPDGRLLMSASDDKAVKARAAHTHTRRWGFEHGGSHTRQPAARARCSPACTRLAAGNAAQRRVCTCQCSHALPACLPCSCGRSLRSALPQRCLAMATGCAPPCSAPTGATPRRAGTTRACGAWLAALHSCRTPGQHVLAFALRDAHARMTPWLPLPPSGAACGTWRRARAWACTSSTGAPAAAANARTASAVIRCRVLTHTAACCVAPSLLSFQPGSLRRLLSRRRLPGLGRLRRRCSPD